EAQESNKMEGKRKEWNQVIPPPLVPPPGLFWTLPKPGCEPVAIYRQATEFSLWTLLAAMQAVERKVDVHSGQIRTLRRRVDLAERKLSATQKAVTDFLPHLDTLGTLVRAYEQLQKRLETMEERLRNPNLWALNVPPGAGGESLQFGNVSAYCSELEWEDLNSGAPTCQKAEESLVSTAVVLLRTGAVTATEPGNLDQFNPLAASSEQDVSPSSEEGLVPVDSRTGVLQPSTESGGDIANFTTIVVQEGVLPGEAPYVCPDCGRSFLYEEQCTLHQQSHLQVSPDHGDVPAQHSQPEVRAYTCPDCGRWFPHQASLSKHRLWHTGDRPHTCAECKKTFRLKINLHLHERTHAVAKKTGCYICSQCGRTFNHHSNFLRHQMIHTGERPYTCGECGKTFIRKEHLATHGRLHTGERPYQCPLCPKSFTRKQHLVGHQRRRPDLGLQAHGVEWDLGGLLVQPPAQSEDPIPFWINLFLRD
uniref:C2H2-type domain-containing protein n=1 Tax=Laticauda laticaudata TaxID=8630 RepID=A0A8C5RUR3_LATLA